MDLATSLSSDRLESRFQDFKPALSESEAQGEANRCITCYDAPCIQACPTRINIPQFISRIASNNVNGAAKTILEANIFGLSCASACPTEVLCEGACVYNNLDKKPILIGKLQRYATERAYEKGTKFFQAGKPTGRKVALIGAGPASLACAHELRRLGHETVVFEKTKIPGGLNTSGIAPYKMKAQVSLREIERVLSLGVKIEYGRELGRDLHVEELLAGYDAVFLGLGLGPDSRLSVPGAESPLIQGAVEFISRMKTKSSRECPELSHVRAALVIGGGNTALDACRELKGLGVARVVVSYRRGEKDMSGYKHELKWARQEGVEFLFHTVPAEFRKGTGDRLVAKLAKTDSPQEFIELEADLVLLGIGQSKLESLLSQTPGLAFENGRLKTDAKTGRTGNPKIYAGGDLANGGMEVVNAVAEGKRAALAIHQQLSAQQPSGAKNG